MRAGGREAVAEVISSARPLADMLWLRETESGLFGTPERRAALETRIHEVVRGIGDEQVRKYYAQDFGGRLRELLMPAPARSIAAPQQRYGGASRSYGGANGRPGPFERRPRFGGGGAREPAPAAGARLSSASPMVRGFRSALPPREALMLVATINHPWLLDSHIEEFAELEFINPDADRLRRVIVEVGTGHGHLESETLREAIEARGLSPVLARVAAAITHPSDWPARPGASTDDVAQWWTHVVTLHRKKRTLNRELKDAERALGEEPTDANLAWLRDVQGRLSALDGSEALIEGFGVSSGRPARSV